MYRSTLNAVDNLDGLGVKRIEYSFDNSVWSTYTGPLSFTSNGISTLYYRAVDNADNVETTKSQTIKIDNIAPTISGTISPLAVNGWYMSNVVVHFSASDGVSGVASVTHDTLISVDGAGQTVAGVAYDAAGNSASATVGNINIDRTKPVVGNISLPAGIAPGVSFTASAGYTELNLDRAVWEWGDGTTTNATVNGAIGKWYPHVQRSGHVQGQADRDGYGRPDGQLDDHGSRVSGNRSPDSHDACPDGSSLADACAGAGLRTDQPGADRRCDACCDNEKEVNGQPPFSSLFFISV